MELTDRTRRQDPPHDHRNPGTVDASSKLLKKTIEDAKSDATFDTLLIEEAWDAVHEGKQDKHDQLIRDAIEEMRTNTIGSCSPKCRWPAAVLDHKSDAEVLTSPDAALKTLEKILN